VLLRHAKAERARPGVKDHERALSERGIADSEEVGRILCERGAKFDLVLCSSAARARQTWEGVAQAFAGRPEPRWMRELYEEQTSYLDIIRRMAGDYSAMLVIGHNPTVQATALELVTDLSGKDGAFLKQRFPTAAAAILDFDAGWPNLQSGSARLTAFVAPRGEAAD
jgi:phosphohistidine phosphatase